MSDPDNPLKGATPEPTGDLYDFLKTEMVHRRTRRQAVFSWVSSLLVGIIGGTVALTYTKGVALSDSQKFILTAVIAILSIFSCLWISHHWREEVAARKNLASYFDRIAEKKGPTAFPIGSNGRINKSPTTLTSKTGQPFGPSVY